MVQASYPAVTLSQSAHCDWQDLSERAQRSAVVVEQRRDVALWPYRTFDLARPALGRWLCSFAMKFCSTSDGGRAAL